jgi:hypothetical protein
MLKFVLFASTVVGGWTLDAAVISIKPGQTATASEKGDVVSCDLETCAVEYQYVGKTYVTKLPSGKVHFESKKKDETLRAAKELVDMKACDRLSINIQD